MCHVLVRKSAIHRVSPASIFHGRVGLVPRAWCASLGGRAVPGQCPFPQAAGSWRGSRVLGADRGVPRGRPSPPDPADSDGSCGGAGGGPIGDGFFDGGGAVKGFPGVLPREGAIAPIGDLSATSATRPVLDPVAII